MIRNFAIPVLIFFSFQLVAPAMAAESGEKASDAKPPVKKELSDAEQEIWIGNLFDLYATEVFVVLHDEKLTQRIVSVAKKIARASSNGEPKIHLRILNDSLPVASSLPGGNLYISTGMLDLLSSEEELAAALAIPVARLLENSTYKAYRSEWKNRKDTLLATQIFGMILTLGLSFASFAATSAGAFQASQWFNLASMSALQGTNLTVETTGNSLPGRNVFMNRLGSKLVPAAMPSGGIVAPPAAASVYIFFQEFYEGYDEEAVLKTDESALTSLSKAGYDPKTLVSLMEKLSTVQNVYKSNGYITSLFLSKPGLEGRIANAKRALEKK